MIIDITALATMIRRMDVSATLKSFVVVLAVLLVLANLARIKDVLQLGFLEAFDSRGFVIAWVVTAAIAAFGPLAFIVWDWMVRQQQWRHISAIGGALIGGVGFAVVGAALGAFGANVVGELETYISAEWFILFAFNGLVVVALIGWLISESRYVRSFAGWMLIVFAACVLAGLLYAAFVSLMEDPKTMWEDFVSLVAIVVALVFVIWLFVRAVRHRIILSGDRPRELFLGAIRCKSFWARLAFLAGLPSSLWHARAILTPAFWAFLLARPLVYAGVLLLLGEINVGLDISATIALCLISIIGGHVLFYTGKRLAARYIWDPAQAHDPRAPVLFLRSFEDDQLRFNRSRWNLVGRWFDLWSFRRNADEAMIDEIAQYGPVVALGMPGETKIPFGAMRYYSNHEDWEKIVTDTAKRAQAIVIGAGDTPGVLWEYEMLAREKLLDRTLLLFQPAATDHHSADAAALDAFVRKTHTDASLDVPEDGHSIALLRTDAGPTLLTAEAPSAGACVLALRAHFQKCTTRQLADRLVIPDYPGIKVHDDPDFNLEINRLISLIRSKRLYVIGLAVIMVLSVSLSLYVYNQRAHHAELDVQVIINPAAKAKTLIGVEYLHEGLYDKALAEFKKALKIDPNLPLTHNSIAVLYEKLGEEELAGKHYRKAYSLDPKNPATLNNYGQYLCQTGRLEEADEMFMQALQDPLYRYPELIFTNAGICAQKKSDLEQAGKYFHEALRKNPKYQPALRHMVRISYESNNHLAARVYLHRLQELSPLTPEFLWLGVQTEAALGDKDVQASYALALKNQYPESEQTQALVDWERKQRGYNSVKQ